MRLSTQTAVLIAALLVSSILAVGIASVGKKSDYITVGGQAEVPISPDRAIVGFSINSLAATASEAESLNSKAVESVKAKLKAQGIDERNVETSYYYLNKRTDWSVDGPVEKGYEVQHSMKITTNASGVSSAIQAAVSAGANGVDSIEFRVSRAAQDAAVATAMQQAADTARMKAESVTDALDVRLGRVLKIEEGSYWIAPSNAVASDAGSVPAEYQANVISPQRMAVQANVNMVFAVN